MLILTICICLVDIFTHFSGINSKEFCVLIVLLSIGISLFAKGIIFKSSNSIWFALIIFLYDLFLFLSIIFGELRAFYGFAFLIIPAVVALIVAWIFMEFIYVRVAVFLATLSIPVLLFNIGILNVWLFIGLLILFGVGGYFLQMCLNFNKDGE